MKVLESTVNTELRRHIEHGSVYTQAVAIRHPRVIQVLREVDLLKLLSEKAELQNHGESAWDFLDWFNKPDAMNIQVPEDMTPGVSDGTTQVFLDHYLRHAKKTLVCLPGEYPFHRDVMRDLGRPFELFNSEIEMDPDRHFAILSLPFSSHGEVRKEQLHFLEELRERRISTLVDCALLGLGEVLKLNLRDYPNVETVAFSFSKSLGIYQYRSGFCFSRDSLGPVGRLNNWSYVNRCGLELAKVACQHIHPTEILEDVRVIQGQICERLQLTPSRSCIFGLGTGPDQFHRGDGAYRFCLSSLIDEQINI